ncbi:uncharacterized protein LOC110465033 [Mizuhopecten yessoensis]|uniref:uncharacterized protein LOC110465033 n=1 Tax=Mizuhopecten yessoensis TaxID=6573 RepID=UPI000B459DF7|nr:uncharacterized protein LOC110465033 [Mizuhopecten yessoensis]
MEFVVLMLVFNSLLREGSPLFMDLHVSRNIFKWEDARKYCQTKNGRLIVLDSQEKWNFYNTHDKYKSNNLSAGWYWTGLRFDDTVQCHTTGDMTTWVYDGWARWSNSVSEPNACPWDRCIRLQNNWMWTSKCKMRCKAICEIGWIDPMRSTTIEPIFETTASGTNDTCDTCCFNANYSRKLDQHEREQIQHSLRVQLAVNKTDLSAQRRKLISVYDSRPSSVAVGGLACVILAAIVGVIVVPDIICLGRYMFKQV